MNFYEEFPQIVDERFAVLAHEIRSSASQWQARWMVDLRNMCGAKRLSERLLRVIGGFLHRHGIRYLPTDLPMSQDRPILLYTGDSPLAGSLTDAPTGDGPLDSENGAGR